MDEYYQQKHIELLSRQNMLLMMILKVTAENLPAHTKDCGVRQAHPGYGNHYCNCNMQALKNEVRGILY